MIIEDLLSKGQTVYAHVDPKDSRRKETLQAHSDLVRFYYRQLCEKNNLSVKALFRELTLDGKRLSDGEQHFLEERFEQAIYLHDLGKVNSEFQRVKMGSDLPPSAYNNSNHSLLSALLYLDVCEDQLRQEKDEDKRAFLRYVLVLFSYIISRHHTCLTDFDLHDYAQKLNVAYEQMRVYPEILHFYARKDHFFDLEIFQKNEDDMSFRLENENICISDQKEGVELYLLLKMLYSCLVTADFLATYQFFNQRQPYFQYLNGDDKQILMGQFQQTDIYRNIREYQHDPENPEISPINRLRSKLFLDTEKELASHPDQSVYFLEAPTGSGKTVISAHLALRLLQMHSNLNKIVYVFPFNSLVEQTKEKLNQWLGNLSDQFRIQVVNSVTPIVTAKEQSASEERTLSEETDYDEELLRRQMLQYPVTVTSHVNLFSHLFGTGRESNLGLATLAGSVVILDEIQSYRNEIWPNMIHMLHAVSKRYHIVFIIMSATLPKLDRLLEKSEKFTPLVTDKTYYFQNPLFKDRVTLNFDLLNRGTLTLEQLSDWIKKFKTSRGPVRLLVEMIKKKSARALYNLLRKAMPGQTIIELTGDDSRYIRKKILDLLQGTDKIKPIKNVIVVATQVIEAGVDIDMDVGMKDISLLDSDEQFLGRINRSALKSNCVAYFFNLDEAETIYKRDLRLEHDLRRPDYQKALLNKDFDQFYALVFKRFLQIHNKRDRSYRQFERQLNKLEFDKISKALMLIDQKTYSLVLNFSIQTDDGELSGENVWEQFKKLLKNDQLSYAEQKIRLSQITAKMDYFTFSSFQKPKYYEEVIGELYYVKNCEDFIEWDPQISTWKFCPDQYIEKSEDDFL